MCLGISLAERVGMATQLETSTQLEWRDGFQTGFGIAAPSGQLLAPAVEKVQIVEPKGRRRERDDVDIVDSEESLNEVSDVEATVGFNAFSVDGKFSSAWRKEVSFHRRCVTILARSEILWETAVASPLPVLTDEARRLLKRSPKKFREAYGDYFIAGYQKRARFYIAYRCEGSDDREFTKFKAEAQLSAPKFFAQGATELQKSAESHKVRVKCVVIREGIEGSGTKALTVKPEQVADEYKSFQERATGTQSQALLYHYCLLDPSALATIDLDPAVAEAAASLFRNLWTAKALVGGVPKNYRAEMKESLDAIDAQVIAEVPRDLDCKVGVIEKVNERLRAWHGRQVEIDGYLQLWRALKAETAAASGENDGNTWYWSAGRVGAIVGAAAGQYISPECLFSEQHSQDWKIGWREWNPVIANSKFRICGYEVIANRHDGLDGSWSRTGGDLRGDTIRFHVQSCYDRSFDWTIKVWGVPAERVRFENDDL